MTLRISTGRPIAHALREYEDRVMADADRRCQIAALTPPMDPQDFARLMCTDKLEAAGMLCEMSEPQRYRQALAHAAYINEKYAFAGDGMYSAWDVLENFERGMRVYRESRVQE